MPNKSSVLVIGEVNPHADLYLHLATEVSLVFAAGADEVIELTSDNEPVGAILVSSAGLGARVAETCHWLKTDNEVKHLPIAVIEEDESRAAEWMAAGASDCLNPHSNAALLVARLRLLLELQHKTELLADIASLDALTSLPDRRRMDEYLDIEWRRSLREFYPLSMIIIDVDGFADFNNGHGIGGGDEALKQIARALEATVNRAADMLSRYGEDEFLALLPGVELDSALLIAERMVEAVRSLGIANAHGATGFLTVSAGVATIEPSRDKRYQDLQAEAEEMLVRCRRGGGDQAQGIEV